ncbi:glycerophosphodiester phosphodiesterase family protein [Flagellimonas flava]|uniref:Glycerophosphoryl diester phosphodiesterase n=1 Tax=Flagellimonas flava TaxID=570519 RepID=A0A1M5IEE3_9FLAO|nr:glycerophosphodiester phosphodiesterase family protein [Allomuricauda flava]SHG26163.1 glycerophosphoryl diester phosphodiesterase [Allomuricauda flava]
MKRLFFFSVLLIWVSCKDQQPNPIPSKDGTHHQVSSIQDKIANLNNSENKEIIVVAHRGDWRNAPENSLKAIQNCIDMGVDMVEIDIRETKDGHLVLMHDETIDRTTTGKGFVNDWTLDSLMTLYLKDGLGVPTPHKIPTLEEALRTTKDKILVNLDKSYTIFDKCFQIVQLTETSDQVLIKGAKTRTEVEQEFGLYLDDFNFMPVIRLKKNSKEIVDDYIKHRKPVAFEFIVSKDTTGLGTYFNTIRKAGSGVWVNSLWPHLSGGHDDEKAAIDITTYQWYLDNNVDIIQTDRPKLLLDYLRSKNMHN